MLNLFGPIANLYNFFGPNNDNVVFKLHYQLTSILLFGLSGWETSRYYLGEPIDCHSSSYSGSPAMANAFCLSDSPFIVYRNHFTPKEEKLYLTYYQWVGSVLFFQAVFFLMPRFLWSQYENGLIESFVVSANQPIAACNDKPEVSNMAKKVFEYRNSFTKTYFIYCFAEVLNLANVIIQFVATNKFLKGHFSFYGLDVALFLSSDQPTVRGSDFYQTSNDPRLKLFPYKAKCTLTEFEFSGRVVKADAICSLFLNTLNGNLYFLLWFWFIILIFLSVGAIIYRAASFYWPSIMFIGFNKESITSAIDQGSPGDWFVMKKISKSLVRSKDFDNLVLELQNLATDDVATNLQNV